MHGQGPGCILDRPQPAFPQTLPLWYFQHFMGPWPFWWYASIRWFVIVLVVWWVCLLYSPLGEMVMASYSQCPHGIPCDNLHVFYAFVLQILTFGFHVHVRKRSDSRSDITKKMYTMCEVALVTAWSQMPRKPAKPRVSGRALSIFKPGVQFDHCDQRFLPLVNSWCTVERITTEAPVYEFYSNRLRHFQWK